MKGFQRVSLIVLVALSVAALVGVILTRRWANPSQAVPSSRAAANRNAALVDQTPLETAQRLARLAVTPDEVDDAQEALRLGDHSVDLAFALALHDAAENPTPLTAETRGLTAREKDVEARVKADQDRVAQLTSKVAKASGPQKDSLQEELELAQAQLSLDQDELDDIQQDLARAGGDLKTKIQQLLDAHEASEQHTQDAHPITNSASAASSPEATQSSNIVAQLRAWSSLRAKETLLRRAQQEALARATSLVKRHDALKEELRQESAQKRILHGPAGGTAPAEPKSIENPPTAARATLSLLHHLTDDQKALTQLDIRVEAEQQLARNYGGWVAVVQGHERKFAHGLLVSILWALLICLLILSANYLIQRFFGELAAERRQMHTVRAIVLLAVQVVGVVLLLVVILGSPAQLATVVALAGAGVTVAMKDFIVGFFGWFVLMGKNGIRPGDWVEINGVGGEVLEVGLLHTVLLETGNWTDAGHPTGRKVTFVNSFAVEGHYFNFSTSGQWLWDELEVVIPEGKDPYAVAEAVQKIVAQETAENARAAEQEWQRVTPASPKRPFSAAPSLSVRPANLGVSVTVRYITRAYQRHEVRARLYRAVVELLHQKKIPQPAPPRPASESAAGRS